MRRRVGQNFRSLLLPAICCAVTAYFAHSAVFGERGIRALRQTEDRLDLAKHDLAAVRAKREALSHRISLLDEKRIDPDLLEEVARGVLLETRPGEVAVPREKR
jgi:cell division protein FtsB